MAGWLLDTLRPRSDAGPGNGVAGQRACDAAGLRITRGPARCKGGGRRGTGVARDARRLRTPGSWRKTHLARGIPAFEAASGEQCSTLQLPPAAGRRVSLTGHPVGRAMLDPSGRPGPGWTLQVLWRETWQSLKPIRVSANAGANGRGFGPSGRNHLLRCSCDVAGTSGRLPAPRRKGERTARPEQRGLSASARRRACAATREATTGRRRCTSRRWRM